jgi:putative membrane-bound dehydrogenase-like protein
MIARFTVKFSCIPLLVAFVVSVVAADDQHVLHTFSRQQLSDVYYSEGISVGDLNNDNHKDVVYGPHWYAGPDFSKKLELYPAVPQPRERYADNFFNWIYDFDGDGWRDVLVVGFPGTPAFVYRNPGGENLSGLWDKHQVADSVSNEAPQFLDITGDGRPELLCTRQGHYGFYSPDPKQPLGAWPFTSISEKIAPTPFGHGLGAGDVNGDGRVDVLATDGWLEHPATGGPAGLWVFHKVPFAPSAADMFTTDVDGDGDADVITALQAHEYGLAWHENLGADGGEIRFQQHLIMGRTTSDNPYGVLFTEPHAVKLADIDQDGLPDIITGKTYWSHHRSSPLWDAGAVVYWFQLQRSTNGDGQVQVDWVPHLADAESGVGRGLVVDDINGDGLPDIASGGMVGASILLHVARSVSHDEFEAAQPRRTKAMAEGLAPEAAAGQMSVPPGFRVQLAAGEPLVHQPIAMCFDHRGRVWVAEAHTYPIRAANGEGRDRIRIFSDENGDGVFDTAKTFIKGLNLVSGLEVGFGGVFVGAAPYLMFIPDADQNDVPDTEAPAVGAMGAIPQQKLAFPKDVPPGAVVLRDGFGWQDTHETLNAFIWGPDGWLYGCHGVFTHSKVGRPGTADAERLPLNAAVWRYHPVRDEFEAFMNGTSNPWGVDFNDRGQAFITACVIPHLWHVIQGARYHRQGGQHFNPHTYEDIKTIADHAHYAGNIGDHAWWGHEPKAAAATLDAGGGHAHCGGMVYLGDNWPAEYRNRIYFNNIHGNRVNCDVLEPVAGTSAWVGRHGRDLLLANDHYYRGINLRYGPDGTVYLIDWYDKNACHRTNPEIWDRTSGRIYRVSWGQPKTVSVDAAAWNDTEMFAAHEHANEWHSRMARRLLMHRGCSPELAAQLQHATLDAARPTPIRLRCLWTLHATRGLSEELVSTLLKDADEYIRAWTIQLELEDQQLSPALLHTLESLAAADKSAVVRLYLASALQRLPLASRTGIAAALAARAEDNTDHNLPLMIWYGVEPLAAADPQKALRIAATAKIEKVRRFIIRRAAAEAGSLPAVITALGQTSDTDQQLLMLQEISAAFEGRVDISMPESWKQTYEVLRASNQQSVRDAADQLAVLFGDQRVFSVMRKLLADTTAELPRRQAALTVLVKGQDRQAADVLLGEAVLLQPELQAAAVRALAGLGNERTPTVLLKHYPALAAAVRLDAVSTLVSRPVWARELLAAIASGTISSKDLHAFHVRQVLAFNDADLTAMLKQHWGEIRESSADRRAQQDALKKQLSPRVLAQASLGNGRRVFTKTCQNCHRLFGTGGEIGPDLTGSNRANLDYILENMLDPSAVVGRDYQVTVLALNDGRVVQGMLKKETDSALTLQTLNDLVVIPKTEIDERSLSGISMMPERQLDSLSRDEIRDLVAYLASPAQVTLAGPASAIDRTTGKVPGAIEGEAMKIIEKSGGNAVSQAMGGFAKDRWSGNDQLWWTGAKPGDRLSLEVPVQKDGVYDVEIVLTRARDYGIVRLSLDKTILDPAVDLYNTPDVITTGVLSYSGVELKAGAHQLTLEITGANPAAVKAFMVAVDYVRLVPAAENK